MAFGLFIHRVDSIYDDSPAERYPFPAQYLDRATPSIGDWILYYEPRKVATQGYFAVAKVERVIADPSAPGMYLAHRTRLLSRLGDAGAVLPGRTALRNVAS